MLYDNRKGHPVVAEIEKLIKKKKVKNIFPNFQEKKPVMETPQEILENSKKYAIFLCESDNFNGNAFSSDIDRAARLTRNNAKKKILYTVLDGDKNAPIVREVKERLDDIPDKQVSYLRKYSPEKMEKFILQGSPKGRAKRFFLFIAAVILLGMIVCRLESKISIIHEFISWFSPFGVAVANWKERLIEAPVVSNLPVSRSVIEGTITTLPVIIIWMILLHREKVSEDPLFWLTWRRRIMLLVVMILLVVNKSASLAEGIDVNSDIVVDFERVVVTNLLGNSESILVPIEGVLEPSGRITLEENGQVIFYSNGNGPLMNQLKGCPPLQEGHNYTIHWETDITEAGQKKFCYHKGEPVVIELESDPTFTDFQSITKAQLRSMVESCGIEFSDEFVIYTENNSETIEINIKDMKDSDKVFTVDIGMVCLRLKCGEKEDTILFELSTDNYTVLGNRPIPSGHVAVNIEF